MALDLDGRSIPMMVRRSPRARRIHLRIDTVDAAIELVLPRWAGLAQGLDFARANRRWLTQRIADLPARTPFADGTVIPVLGELLTIRHQPGQRGPAHRGGDALHIGGRPEHVARRVRDWLKAEARARFAAMARELAATIGRKPGPIRLTDPRTRWGSCSPEGAIALSWRLVLAPPEVTRYVVAHEVAHLAELNHGRRFWRVVGELIGDHDTARLWLRRHGAQLLRYG
jgi:predicted metal-dependent hydrolase